MLDEHFHSLRAVSSEQQVLNSHVFLRAIDNFAGIIRAHTPQGSGELLAPYLCSTLTIPALGPLIRKLCGASTFPSLASWHTPAL